jgi:hypothetical protein
LADCRYKLALLTSGAREVVPVPVEVEVAVPA